MRVPALFVALCLIPVSLPAQQPTTPLVGVVVDADGKPVTDAVVMVSRAEGRGFSCLDLELRDTWRELVRTPVDRNGRFGLQLPMGLVLRVDVDHPGHAVWRRSELVPGEELRIELGPPCTFRGRLVMAGSGKGMVGTLRAWDAERTELLRGRTDGEGNFVFERLPAGRFTCDVAPDLAMSPQWFDGILVGGETLDHEFQLNEGAQLQGRVTDAITGEPIAGARIGEGWTLHKAVVTDARGHYTLIGHGDQGRPDVHCAANGYARGIVDRQGLPLVASNLDFALEPGVHVTGTILDPDGRPRADVYAALVGATGNHVPWLPTRTDADGRFTCAGLAWRADAMLLLRCNGSATAVYALPEANAHAEIDIGTLRLLPPQIVRGTVRNTHGEPVKNTIVELHGTNDDCERFARLPGSWGLLSNYLGQRQARTDQSGAFAFGDVAPGSYSLVLQDAMAGTANVAALDVVAGVDPPPVVIER